MTLLQKKTVPLLALCLILNACAAAPISTKFDGKWEFCELRPQTNYACLSQPDVEKLRIILIQCEGKK